MPFTLYAENSELNHKAQTVASVNLWCASTKAFVSCDWPAVLDTGSPYTIVPGTCQRNQAYLNELIPVDLMGSYQGTTAYMRFIGGRPRKFGGVGATRTVHIPFKAEMVVQGLGLFPFQTVYFEKLDHVIVGTDVLFRRNTICFTAESYRAGKCWLHRIEQLW